MPIGSYNDILTRIINIWSDFYTKYVGGQQQNTWQNGSFLLPGIPEQGILPDRCKLLILGLNPSYNLSGWKTILRSPGIDYTNLSISMQSLKNSALNNILTINDLDNYFDYNNYQNQIAVEQPYNPPWLNDLKYVERAALHNHPYFGKMGSLANHIFNNQENPPWIHLDLFYYRVTNANTLKKLRKRHVDFFDQQLTLTMEIIQWLDPKIIFISNAYASEIFRELISGSNEKFFQTYPMVEKTGSHMVPINQTPIPVFFSGMLSGQRALDLGSYERLKWHIKAVFDGKVMTTPNS